MQNYKCYEIWMVNKFYAIQVSRESILNFLTETLDFRNTTKQFGSLIFNVIGLIVSQC